MKCAKCGTENDAGALLCESCNEPFENLNVATGSPSANSGQVCKLVESGKVTDKEFNLPEDDFDFSIGRTDLDEGIIPDIDLLKYGQKVEQAGEFGYTFSRKHATLSRKTNRLCLKSIGAAKTMIQKKGGSWEKLAKDQEVELNVGDRFRFGGTEGAVIFEVN